MFAGTHNLEVIRQQIVQVVADGTFSIFRYQTDHVAHLQVSIEANDKCCSVDILRTILEKASTATARNSSGQCQCVRSP